MWWNDLSRRWRRVPGKARRARPQTRPRHRLRPEQLEDRTLLTSYTAASVSDLIADINAANLAGGSNTIALVAGTTFTLTAPVSTPEGATGLPMIAANDRLTIVGNGDVVERSTAAGTPTFRLMVVGPGASLTLQNLTLQGGISTDTAWGGGIDNEGGSLTLSGVTVQNNSADLGGGIVSENGQNADGSTAFGSLTMQGCTIRNNRATRAGGGVCIIGWTASLSNDTVASNTVQGVNGAPGLLGGSAYGGGIYIESATVGLSNVTLSSNVARGGNGGAALKDGGGGGKTGSGGHHGGGGDHPGPGNGGNGVGGGIYVASGTLTLLNTSMSSNTAMGGLGGGKGASAGQGIAGGRYIEPAASVSLDAFTQAHIINNSASTADPNIDGSYTTV
jgi:hypothetical protein